MSAIVALLANTIKDPLYMALFIICALSYTSWMFCETNRGVQAMLDSQNSYPSAVLLYSLAGASGEEEIVSMTRVWIDRDDGAQLGAVSVLCNEKDRAKIKKILGDDLATNMCRLAKIN